MKFKRGDIVYYLPFYGPNATGYDVMLVVEYDQKRGKYKCLNLDEMGLGPQSISYCFERDIEFYHGKGYSYYCTEKLPMDYEGYDELYFPVYDCDGEECVKIRNAYRHFKNYN